MKTNIKTMRYLIVGACLSAATLFSTGAFAEAKFHFNAGSSANKHANKNYEKKHRNTSRHSNRRHHDYRYWHGTHPSYYGHHHGHPSSGVSISYRGSINSRTALSLAAFAFVVGGLDYYFDDGYYYHHTHGRYHRVHAPIGARIHHLPRGYSRVTIGHTHYYTYRDVYYTWDRHNHCYTVVANPYHDRHDHSHDSYHDHEHGSNHSHSHNNRNSHEHSQHGNRNDNHRDSHYRGEPYDDGYGQRNERPRSQAHKPEVRHADVNSNREPRSAIAVEQNKRYDCHIAATKVANYDPTKDPYSVYKSKKYSQAHTSCLSKNGLVVR